MQKLSRALDLCSRITERRNTIPILDCALIEAGSVSATNLDIEIKVSVPDTGVKKPVAIHCHPLARLIKNIPPTADILITGSTIKFNDAAYQFAASNGNDFPHISFPDDAPSEDVRQLDLVTALKRVSFAISKEETRYYLNGVCLRHVNGAPTVVATDGHRLAMTKIGWLPRGADGAIIPRDLVKFLVDTNAKPLTLAFHEKACCIVCADMTLTAKLIDGTFPEVERVIPKSAEAIAEVDRNKLLQTLRRIVEAHSEALDPCLKFTFGVSSVLISGKGDHIAFNEIIECNGFKPSFVEAYNANYLLEIFNNLRSKTVVFKSESAGAPTQLVSDDSLQVIVMPMRVPK